MAYDAAHIRGLVREAQVHRDVYTDPAMFELEMDRLFGRAWILLGHDSQLRRPGDYITGLIGREPVISTRGEDGAIRVLLNRCPHRGARICGLDAGHAKRLQCPYHGWTFTPDGDLVAVPMKEEYGPDFDAKAHGLTPVARVALYRGFLFASLATEGPDLESFLGHMTTSIDDLVDRSPTGEVEAAETVIRHRYRGNWKLMFENLNDTIHAGFAHHCATAAAQALAKRVGPENTTRTIGMMLANGKPLSAFNALEMVVEQNGHSYFGAHIGADYSDPAQDAYAAALVARHGEAKARAILSVGRHVTQIYPSCSFQGRYQTVRIVRPLAVDLTEVVGYVFRLKGAPEEVFRSALEYCTGAVSAASPVIADDLEIYETSQRHLRAAGSPWVSVHRAAGQRLPPDGRDLSRHPATSEAFIRNQFAAWTRWMAAETA
jgi:phenylpropionate dioxygenase-like ring-hydroxylating dioxygenase large terminal subunit